jgi:DNA-binding NarL/FixJ family response regulator
MSIKILLADDHLIMRSGLRSLLDNKLGIEVISETTDGQMTISEALKLKPDVVIMDIALPHLNGMDATRQIVSKIPSIKIIALSMYSDKRFILGMLSAGASGYLPKNCVFDELIDAIHSVFADNIYLSPSIAKVVVKDYLRRLSNLNKESSTEIETSEKMIIKLLAQGQTTSQIASALDKSVKTVAKQRRRIMEKLDTFTIAEITKYAIREGLTSLEY